MVEGAIEQADSSEGYLGPETVWDLDEYVTRAEFTSPRDLLVEGGNDVYLYERFLRELGIEDAAVFSSASLRVSAEDIEAAGFRPGAKGKLLALAAKLAASVASGPSGTVLIVVDRDYDEVPGPELESVLCVTAVHSVESHAVSRSALSKFEVDVLGRRRDARVPARIGLYDRAIEACTELAAVRLVAQRCNGKDLGDAVLKKVAVDSDGRGSLDGSLALRRCCLSNAPLPPPWEVELRGARSKATSDPPTYVRGRDFVEVVRRVLGSSWGRRTCSGQWHRLDASGLSRLLLRGVSDEDPGVLAVKTRFAAAFGSS